MNIQELAEKFSQHSSELGYGFECQMIPGEADVLQIEVENFEEIPVFLSYSESQLICISYLWGENEVNPSTKQQLHETLLDMNISVPLSSFSRVGDKYVIFGAMSVNSDFEDIVYEVVNLTQNAVEAISALEDFLL